jgi:hypothetical protein
MALGEVEVASKVEFAVAMGLEKGKAKDQGWGHSGRCIV